MAAVGGERNCPQSQRPVRLDGSKLAERKNSRGCLEKGGGGWGLVSNGDCGAHR